MSRNTDKSQVVLKSSGVRNSCSLKWKRPSLSPLAQPTGARARSEAVDIL